MQRQLAVDAGGDRPVLESSASGSLWAEEADF